MSNITMGLPMVQGECQWSVGHRILVAVMAKVVVATLTQEHGVEITKTYWTIILKLVS